MHNIEKLAKEILTKKNMSIEKLAVQSGLTKSTVISIFKKNDAKISQLEAISKVLEVPVSYFFENTHPEKDHLNPKPKQTTESDDSFWKDQIRLKDKLLLEERERLKKCEQELTRLKNDKDGFYDQKLTR